MSDDPRRTYSDINAIRLDIAERKSNRLYLAVIGFLVVMIVILLWLNSPWRPQPLSPQEREGSRTEQTAGMAAANS